MSKFPVLVDRHLRPLKTKGMKYGWNYKPTNNDILEDFILTDKNKSLTFVSLEFSRIRLIDDPHTIARTVMNRNEQRFELHLNINRMKRLYWCGELVRVLRKPYGYQMPDLITSKLPRNFDSLAAAQQKIVKDQIYAQLTSEELFWTKLPDATSIQPKDAGFKSNSDAKEKMRRLFYQVIHHEFGHLWFWHLKNDIKVTQANAKFVNMAQDALLNYHLGIHDMGYNEIQAYQANWYTALLPILYTRINVPVQDFAGMSVPDFREQFKSEQLSALQYLAWRVLDSQLKTFKKWPIKTIISKVEEIRHKVRNYAGTAMEIAEDIQALFPEKDGKSEAPDFDCAMHGASGGDGDKDEFINVQDMKVEDLPPQFQKLLEDQILKGIGIGGNMLSQLLKNIKDVQLKKQFTSTLHKYTERDPSRFIIKKMKVESLYKVEATYRPTKHPAAKSMAMAYSLAQSNPAKFYPKYTAVEKKSLNTLSIYFDVSGSFWHMTPKIFGLIKELEKEFTVKLWQFSTEIHPLTLEEVHRGEFKSTGGTDGNCITKHMRETCDTISNFVVLGDRAYGHFNQVNFPKCVTILDMTTDKHYTRPWFQRSNNVKVGSVLIDEDFNVEKEVEPE